MNVERYIRRIEPQVVLALDIDDEDARRASLETIAERAFAFAYDGYATNASNDDLTIDDVREFTNGLGALDYTTPDSSAERVADWIARAADNAAMAAAAPPNASFTWRTQRDDRVRDIHASADGQVRAAGKPFDIDGHPLMYPGQPIGPPNVWANCRCRLEVAASLSAAASTPSGAVIVAVPADPESVAFPGGEGADALHVTIGYWREDQLTPELRDNLEAFLATQGVRDPVARVSGAGRLGDDDPPATVLLLESDELSRIRAALLAQLSETPPDMKYPEFTPHMTIGYGTPVPDQHPSEVELDPDLELWWQGEQMSARQVDHERLAEPLRSEAQVARAFKAEQRRKLADEGKAMPDGSFPIATVEDLRNAIQAIGRAKDPEAVKRHIRKRARALGQEDLIPDAWTAAVPKPANTHDAPGWLTNPRETQRLRDYWTKGPGAAKIRWGSPGDLTRCVGQLEKYVGPYAWGTCNNLHHVVFGFFNPESGGRRGAGEDSEIYDLVSAAFAAAAQLEETAMLPPAALFADPGLTGPTPLTVRAAGEFNEVFGHLATWDTCHVGMGGSCTRAPKSMAAYAYYRTGEVDTDEGPVAVGHITAGTGHADLEAGPNETVRHYDDTGTVVADVAAGEDEHGIWVHGIQRPGISDEQAYALRAGAPSGDWRRIGKSLELVGALIVNVPGFPIPRTQVASAGEREVALVAAAIVTRDPSMPLLAEEIAVAVVDEQERRQTEAFTAAARRQRAKALSDRVRQDRVRKLLATAGSRED